MSASTDQQNFRDRFYQLSIDSKEYNREASRKAREIFEEAMSEINRLNDIISDIEATNRELSDEIEEQVKIIVKQKDEIHRRS